MASVSNSNNSYSSLSSSIRGYGGLASGIDRDTMIEQMTSATRSKIAKQKQNQTKLEWEQTALRDITTKIYNFTNSYTSYASSTNLLSGALFARNKVSAVGANSKYVSVSGTATAAENMSIARVKQLASNASMTTNDVSLKALKTGEMILGSNNGVNDLSALSDVSTIAGDAMYIKYGTQTYTVKLLDTDEYDYSTPEKAIESINRQLGNVNIGSSSDKKTLGDVMKAELVGNKVTFKLDASKAAGNAVSLAGGTGNILNDLGFLAPGQDFDDLEDDESKLITEEGLTGTYDAQFTVEQTLAQRLSGKEVSFSYNGQVKWITLDKFNASDSIDKVVDDLNKKLENAFGRGRIKVAAEEGTNSDGKATASLSFTTTKPNGGGTDGSSVLAITAGTGIMGNSGAFGVPAGASNRVNLTTNLSSAGFANAAALRDLPVDANGNYNLVINGKKVEGITKDSTINDIMRKINATEGIGVSVAYQAMSDRFVITATDNGASGQISFDNVPDSGDSTKETNLAKFLFGDTAVGDHSADTANGIPASTCKVGRDAILSVKYPGSEDEIEITRASNTFTLDGLNVTLKGTFGYQADGVTEDDTAEAITFEAEVDADKTVDAVKGMIDAFNEILELVNTECKTKPDRDYSPLTDEQKEELSEKEIERWEEKAKKGLLFADMDLRMMSDRLRAVINSGDRSALSNMGITTSTNYNDNGKLVFDETKFRAALQSNPDAVREMFAKEASTNADGSKNAGGLMTNIKAVMDRYGSMTGATKGVLVERAGSIYAPTTVLTNSLQKQMDRIDDLLDSLGDKLETEIDRYISQFTTLESLISQMNSQSGYLSSMFGG